MTLNCKIMSAKLENYFIHEDEILRYDVNIAKNRIRAVD